MKRYVFKKNIYLKCGAAVGGIAEKEGPVGEEFDLTSADTKFGMDSWEKAEAETVKIAVGIALKKAKMNESEIDIAFAGDLINQCTSTSSGIKDYGFSYAGLYGACSTFALSLGMSALSVESGMANTAICATSSHFCSAERQFRFPIEYGSQRTPSAQNTVTGAGAVIVDGKSKGKPKIKELLIGRIIDNGITDPNNMGAAMAPAACDTIINYFSDNKCRPEDFDMILTGDLGFEGKTILEELLYENGLNIGEKLYDCGLMIYDREKQDVHSGGSGCACSATVFSSHILNEFNKKNLKDILFIGTGALLNSSSVLQKQSIPGIAHLVRISA